VLESEWVELVDDGRAHQVTVRPKVPAAATA